mmetsp:Transcript_28243/g.65572  ORF Transcript_28243/g.65572 Transcript_28243/m.65572 type:complete len:113 (-) Transcript_28243:133-471(-)
MARLNSILQRMPKFPWSGGPCPVVVQVWSMGGARDTWYHHLADTVTQRRLGPFARWNYDHVLFVFQPGSGNAHKLAKHGEQKTEDLLRFLAARQKGEAPRVHRDQTRAVARA